ncbi:hypothetical protein [uncultured Algibacter sp.]|uniref:hypothetical protein n=1 Tax=uncultured Algibacter sp. TaxID=298659 RepID=UPI00262765AF|nr:hypothetical protein [uncultured Algibacter sp.]
MKKWILILFLAILIGIYFGLGTVFGLFKLLTFFGISTLILIILLFVWKKPSKKRNYSISVYLIIFFGLIFCILFTRLKKEYNQHNADLIAGKIIEYKTEFEKYPSSLTELKNDTELPKYLAEFEFKDFEYSVNKTTNEFNLTYSLDGWHINEYDSETNQWKSRD